MTERILMLVGRQIVLRDWRVGDLPALHDWLAPRHRWHETDGPYYPPMTPEERDSFRDRLQAEIERGEWEMPRQRLVIAERMGDTLIGSVSWYWESRETNWRRMGIVIYDPAFWGHGIGTEALALWTDYLFRHTDVVRLDFSTWSGNVGMMRVGEKLGFTTEARFRKARIVRGTYYDSVVMGVLREEWEHLRHGHLAQVETGQGWR